MIVIDEFSLQTLVDISQHGALSKVITHLIIGLDELRAVDYQVSQLQSLDEFHRWRTADCAQRALLTGGGAVDLLSQALANLPNLKTIDIRDFNSNTRFRDATPGKRVPPWRSYGSSRYQQWPQTSPWLLSLASETTFLDTVFLTVLTAASRCSTALQGLEVILRNRQACLHDEAFSICGVPRGRLADALRGLNRLHLDLGPSIVSQGSNLSGFAHRLPASWPQHDWCDPSTAYLRHFLALTPNLRWLRLNFYAYRHGGSSPSHPSKLISWLALRPDFNAPVDAPWGDGNPAPVTLPLRRLDLGYLTTTPAILRRLLSKFADLENISMRDIWLRGPAATSDSDQNDDDDNGDCLSAKFIRKLHVTNPKLKQVDLRGIWEGKSYKYNSIVFRNEDDPTQCVDFTSTRIIDTTTLERLADNTLTDTRWYQSRRNNDSMDEDSQDEDVMEESMDDESEELEEDE